MPAEGVPARSHDDILSYEELAAFARVAAGCGISKVRITGGEPLVRHGPFVMSDEGQIVAALQRFQTGGMGRLSARATSNSPPKF